MSGPSPGFSVELTRGDAALRFLASRDSAASWARLRERCPWSTASQSPEFASTWFSRYEGTYAPLFVAGVAASGELVGLLALGVSAETGELVAAGGHHAEYQTWLADAASGDSFAAKAFDALRLCFPGGRLVLRYLAPRTPTAWIAASGAWARRCTISPMPRALVDVSSAASAGSLRKRGNRSRLGRLKRLGEIRFERIVDPVEFSRVLAEVVPMYDLRQGAENDVLPFAADPAKLRFHEALFAAGALHASVLRVGGRVAAAHVGVIDGDTVNLGVFAHSPFFAEHSPGKLLLHMLFGKLAQEGFASFDMTPGPGWKERFATRTDVVSTLTVHFRAVDSRLHRARLGAERVAKACAVRLGTTPDAVRRKLGKVRSLSVRRLRNSAASRMRRVRKWFRDDVEYCIYTMEKDRAADAKAPTPFAVDRIEDLLLFRPMEDWQTRQGFLAESVERLGAGDHVYTYVENGALLCYGWLGPDRDRSHNSEVGQELLLPPGSAVAYDYHTHPLGRGKGLHKSALATALAHAASLPGTTKVWTGVLADNGPSRHNCVKMGWSHDLSQWKHVRFGKTRHGA